MNNLTDSNLIKPWLNIGCNNINTNDIKANIIEVDNIDVKNLNTDSITIQQGSEIDPALKFPNNAGIFQNNNDVSFSVNNIKKMSITDSKIELDEVLELLNGSETNPSLVFNNSSVSGLYSSGTDIIDISIDEKKRVSINTNDINLYLPLNLNDNKIDNVSSSSGTESFYEYFEGTDFSLTGPWILLDNNYFLVRVGKLCIFTLQTVLSVAIASSTITGSNIPLRFRPKNDIYTNIVIEDNGFTKSGFIQVKQNGDVVISVDPNFLAFSGAGSTGFYSFSMCWDLN